MDYLIWIREHWIDLSQNIAIFGGFLFTAFTLRREERTRQISNLLEITKQHRDIWTEIYRRPELARVRDMDVDLKTKPLEVDEELFVNFLILLLNASFHAMKNGVLTASEGLRKDVRRFFSLPLPRVVWEKMKPFQDTSFVTFVESCLSEN